MPDINDVKTFLASHGLDVLEFETATPTAETAAAAVGCTAAEIAKSILMLIGGQPVLVVTSGDMKVNSSLLKKTTGLSGRVKLPDAEMVVRFTGYEPGGVSPFLLPPNLPVFLDTSLKRFGVIYPACGSCFSAVALPFEQLLAITGGSTVEVSLPLK